MPCFVRLTRWNASLPPALLQKTSVQCAAGDVIFKSLTADISVIASALLPLNSSTVEYKLTFAIFLIHNGGHSGSDKT